MQVSLKALVLVQIMKLQFKSCTPTGFYSSILLKEPSDELICPKVGTSPVLVRPYPCP